MRVLIVAATAGEIPRLSTGRHGRHDLDVLVTGVGMVATAIHTTRALTATPFDLALNLGVCGSFDHSLPLGAVVHVVHDVISELGAEDDEGFLPIEELGLAATAGVHNQDPPASRVLNQLPAVRGITVNTVHGRVETINAVVQRLQPQVESMEGAAFAMSCAAVGVPYAEVRAVSNRVERRNRESWDLDLAIRRLNDVAVTLIEDL